MMIGKNTPPAMLTKGGLSRTATAADTSPLQGFGLTPVGHHPAVKAATTMNALPNTEFKGL
jgi:hypothetical protein